MKLLPEDAAEDEFATRRQVSLANILRHAPVEAGYSSSSGRSCTGAKCRTFRLHIVTQHTVRRDSMMRRTFVMLALLLVLTLTAGFAHAQTGSGLVDLDRAERYGLQRAWFTQARVNPARDEIGGMYIHVSSTKAQNISEVITATDQRFVYSDRNLDLFGDPIGIEGAQKNAQEKLRMLQAEGIEARVEQRVVPDVTLYMSTTCGIIHAIDAETGATRWVAAAGKRDYPASTPAVSEKYVAVANGSTFYLLNADDGTLIWKRQISGIPSGSAAIAGGYVMVTTLNGSVESYLIDAPLKTALLYRSRGAIVASPTLTGKNVVWPTTRGDINVVVPGQRQIRFRLMTNDPIAGSVAFSPPGQLFVATRTGYLYSFDETRGDLIWQYSIGEETRQSPVVIDGTVYVATIFEGMHAVSAADGTLKWWTPGVRQLVAATSSHLYAVTSDHHFVILDVNNGTLLARIPAYENDFVFTNSVTDRIYIGSRNGLVQCLHERGADWPTIHSPEPSPQSAPGSADDAKKPAGEATEAPEDPFGGAKAAPAAEENPFK